MRAAAAAVVVVVSVVAIGCATSGPGDVGDVGDAGDAGPPRVARDACGAMFETILGSRCSEDRPPPDVIESMRDRFVRSCVARLSLPATSATPARTAECAATARQAGCDAKGRPNACVVRPGALADGAACVDDAQCASTRCERVISSRSGRAPVVPACGHCAPAGRVGEACGGGSGSDACVDGATCDATPGGSRTCVATRVEPVRSACPCLGLKWSRAGHPCSVESPCTAGACPHDGATCPAVLPDGAACVAFDPHATCDAYAACTDGMCSLEYTAPCR